MHDEKVRAGTEHTTSRDVSSLRSMFVGGSWFIVSLCVAVTTMIWLSNVLTGEYLCERNLLVEKELGTGVCCCTKNSRRAMLIPCYIFVEQQPGFDQKGLGIASYDRCPYRIIQNGRCVELLRNQTDGR